MSGVSRVQFCFDLFNFCKASYCNTMVCCSTVVCCNATVCCNTGLSPGDGEKDEMQKLEERARQLAEESMKDTPKPDKGILFVR